MLIVVLLGLGAAWGAIEGLHHVRITVFQPFRMATLARGLALVLVAGRLVDLWDRGTWLARVRSVLIGVALTGDWLLVVVTLAEAGDHRGRGCHETRGDSRLLLAHRPGACTSCPGMTPSRATGRFCSCCWAERLGQAFGRGLPDAPGTRTGT